ncbi:hypothetical protein CBM2592_A230008 [Cupriavidus taiwanensis]|nr:hypothetical protein CBM2592_A230008 [Cupriavidus taiwanensis]SOY83666.1 hypothetical protein CBM2591_A270018 [Cupriavidus taiwanensis]SOZ57831.1 hypothetical protein CBM2617_A260008 [Cupriavidus taiwanensis]SOZ79702.1 hypothetical protein CBM2618_A230015 [Cupriavidus taiwanensis]SOZ80307.1 hypothetical protein CBM2622_A210159 [Cupriavidus taiwanensis]
MPPLIADAYITGGSTGTSFPQDLQLRFPLLSFFSDATISVAPADQPSCLKKEKRARRRVSVLW